MKVHNYTICNQADYEIYQKQCAALEAVIPDLKKVQELHDVDDSHYAIYNYNGKKVTVKNSHYVDAVYIESEIPLEPFFTQSNN